MNNKPTPEIKSAIIGYYRCGSPMEQISHLVNVRYKLVEDIIGKYFENQK